MVSDNGVWIQFKTDRHGSYVASVTVDDGKGGKAHSFAIFVIEGKTDVPISKKEDEDEEKEIKYVPAASAKLEPDKKEIFIFFFKNTGENSGYNLKSIDFDPETFPAGSFWFF